jgi:hypothetical protein
VCQRTPVLLAIPAGRSSFQNGRIRAIQTVAAAVTIMASISLTGLAQGMAVVDQRVHLVVSCSS